MCIRDSMYNEGISRLGDMIDVAVEGGIITKSGSWFSFNDERCQGRDGMRKLLSENAALYAALDAACLLYTSDAADERSSVDLGGRRIIKKKNIDTQEWVNSDRNQQRHTTKKTKH